MCLNSSESFTDEEIFPIIAHLSTAAILSLTGDDEAQAQWEGINLDDWISNGQIEVLQ